MKTLKIIAAAMVLPTLAVALSSCASMGGHPSEESMEAYRASTNYRENEFINATPVNLEIKGSMVDMLVRLLFDTSRKPSNPLPMVPLTATDFGVPSQDLEVRWLGHSTTILEINGIRILNDPVFGKASPVPYTVHRFQPSPITREELPPLDVVVISHDHYDHLEMETIKYLIDRVPVFIVPLGVGAHLEKWGCPKAQIVELDWWQGYWIKDVEIIATPSRHFSGRGLRDRNSTLWASYVFKGPRHRAFYSADGGYDARFKEIGQRFGPFDLTMMEMGAFDARWPDVHMFPEESITAHTELGGAYLLPVHWGVYDLAFHRWDAPARLATQHAQEKDVRLLTPKMGEQCIPGTTSHTAWWEELETDT